MACSVAGVAPHKFASAATADVTMAPTPTELELSDIDWIGDLGEGGFARVSKVRHRRTGEVFALKEAFCPSPDAQDEAEVLRRAAGSPSPFVVRCHAVFLGENGGLTSVLELMDGGTLLDVFYRRGERGFPEPVLAEVAARCLMGLAEIHSRGVAHLDVKPDNFLVNTRGEVKINDFNTSRVVFGSAGESLQVPTNMGTVAYFSPERFVRHDRADARRVMAADVWGLGITILELFLGEPSVVPEADEPQAVHWKKAICDREAPSVPGDVEASVELRSFVAACLHKDPTRRATVPELLNHPFVSRRDVATSSRALREFIAENL